jgi:hypothetical protein
VSVIIPLGIGLPRHEPNKATRDQLESKYVGVLCLCDIVSMGIFYWVEGQHMVPHTAVSGNFERKVTSWRTRLLESSLRCTDLTVSTGSRVRRATKTFQTTKSQFWHHRRNWPSFKVVVDGAPKEHNGLVSAESPTNLHILKSCCVPRVVAMMMNSDGRTASPD